MLSLSTAFNFKNHRTWQELLRDSQALGFPAVELNVEIPQSWFPDIERSVSAGDILISSLHNYCPRIENLPSNRSIYSGYHLTSQDEEERKLAVTNTLRTIEHAARVNAQAVVIHAGEVPTDPTGTAFFNFARMGGKDGKLFQQYYDTLFADRRKKAPLFLGLLMKSLEACIPAAQRHKVTLCLENRYYVNEIPSIEECLFLFEQFKGAPLAYWHDTGHAEVFVRLGCVKKHTDFLDALGSKLFGMHLHDIKGFSDHRAPGTGEFDFALLKPYVTPRTLCVVEAHAKATHEEVKKSVAHLRGAGIPCAAS